MRYSRMYRERAAEALLAEAEQAAAEKQPVLAYWLEQFAGMLLKPLNVEIPGAKPKQQRRLFPR